MKLKEIQIEQSTFFKVGIVCFGIIALANLFTLFYFWQDSFIGSKISSIAGIIFDIAMLLFFNYLLNMSREQITEEYASDDVNEIIQKIKRGNHEKTKNV